MNSFLVLLVVACASYTRGDDQTNALVMNAFKKCSSENPITEEEMQQVKDKVGVPNSHNAKCLMACMMKEGKMLKDGVYNKDNAVLMADVLNKENPDMAAKAKQVVETCSSKVGSDASGDECEFAFKLTTCAAEEAHSLGVARPDF